VRKSLLLIGAASLSLSLAGAAGAQVLGGGGLGGSIGGGLGGGGLGGSVGGTVDGTISVDRGGLGDGLRDRVQDTRDRADERAGEVRDRTKQKAGETRDRVRGRLAQTRDAAQGAQPSANGSGAVSATVGLLSASGSGGGEARSGGAGDSGAAEAPESGTAPARPAPGARLVQAASDARGRAGGALTASRDKARSTVDRAKAARPQRGDDGATETSSGGSRSIRAEAGVSASAQASADRSRQED
jgi:hypothetical protein